MFWFCYKLLLLPLFRLAASISSYHTHPLHVHLHHICEVKIDNVDTASQA